MENKYIKAKRQDRAKMFMPFAALRGYYDLIREQARKKEAVIIFSAPFFPVFYHEHQSCFMQLLSTFRSRTSNPPQDYPRIPYW